MDECLSNGDGSTNLFSGDRARLRLFSSLAVIPSLEIGFWYSYFLGPGLIPFCSIQRLSTSDQITTGIDNPMLAVTFAAILFSTITAL